MENFLTREMLEFLVMMSNYLILLCMGFYTLDCFFVFRYRDDSEGGFLYLRQNFWLFVIQLISFFDLAYVSKEYTYIFLYMALQIFFFIVLSITPLIYRKVNRLLLNNMCMLLGIGMVTISRLDLDKAIRQFEIIALCYVLCMFIPIIIYKTNFLPKLTWGYAVAGAVLLGAVCLFSESIYGSKLSFTIEGFSFQPSEIVKILFILFMAGALSQCTSFKRIIITSLIAAAHVLILVLSTDLGSALIFFVAYLAVIFVASKNYIYLLLGLGGGCGAAVLAYHLFAHVRTRVLAWQDPWTYIDDQGYQITQSLFAIGSGSWFGLGLYKGNPDDIPFVEDDFIYSSICEEMGTIFGILLVLIILSCFIMIVKISLKTHQPFYRLTAFGFSIVYIFQVFLTIGGGIKFIPLTGVTLPFISYGGSSVATMMIMFFILHGINMIADKEQKPQPETASSQPDTDVDNDFSIDLDNILDLDAEEESYEREESNEEER